MTIVMNTFALSALTGIDGLDLVIQLFKEIIIPKGVLDEFSEKFKHPPHSIRIQQLSPSQIERGMKYKLGKGEREAIILAQDLGIKLVIEDKKAAKIVELKLKTAA